MVRAESPNETRWIDDHLRSNGFFEAGHLASYHCQYRALKLKPWEFLPVWMDNVTATLKEPHNRIGDCLSNRAASRPRSTATRPRSLLLIGSPKPIPEMPAGSATSPSHRAPDPNCRWIKVGANVMTYASRVDLRPENSGS